MHVAYGEIEHARLGSLGDVVAVSHLSIGVELQSSWVSNSSQRALTAYL